MKRFEFRLESVLKWKKRREWLAQLRQRQARATLDKALAVVHVLQAQLAQSARLFEAALGSQRDLASGFEQQQQSVLIGRLLETAEAEARTAEQHYQEASTIRTQMATEVEALLFLKKQRWEEYRKEAARAQIAELDELGMRRWLATQDKLKEES